MTINARIAVSLTVAVAILLVAAPSHAAQIRYDFQGYVGACQFCPSLPSNAVGGSLTPLSAVSGHFSYVQEDAVLAAENSGSAFYEFAEGAELFLTNGTETFATNSNFFMNITNYFFSWDVAASTTPENLGPTDFRLSAQFYAAPFPPGFPNDPIPLVPGAGATRDTFTDANIYLEVPSPFRPTVSFSVNMAITSLQGHVVPEPPVSWAIACALAALVLLRLRESTSGPG